MRFGLLHYEGINLPDSLDATRQRSRSHVEGCSHTLQQIARLTSPPLGSSCNRTYPLKDLNWQRFDMHVGLLFCAPYHRIFRIGVTLDYDFALLPRYEPLPGVADIRFDHDASIRANLALFTRRS